jgi:hypothetical protein
MKKSITPILSDTYLALIRNSVGSKLFRNFFCLIGDKKKDILRNGDLSCAMYVSSILLLVKLIPQIHTTVNGTINAMKEAGWKTVQKPKPGSIIVWEANQFGSESHRHIGFYLGQHKAISNNSRKGYPAIHHWTFGQKQGRPNRKVEAIYWNKKLG